MTHDDDGPSAEQAAWAALVEAARLQLEKKVADMPAMDAEDARTVVMSLSELMDCAMAAELWDKHVELERARVSAPE